MLKRLISRPPPMKTDASVSTPSTSQRSSFTRARRWRRWLGILRDTMRLKFQVPSSKFQKSSSLQTSKLARRLALEIWRLEFSWNLELGTWNFSSHRIEHVEQPTQ